MKNRVIDGFTGIVDLAEILIQEKQDKDSLDGINKSQRENVLRKLQGSGVVDKDLTVYYWQNANDLDELIVKELIIDLCSVDNVLDLSEKWIESCKVKVAMKKTQQIYNNEKVQHFLWNYFIQR